MRVGDLGLNKKLRWLGKGGVSLSQGPTWEERMGRFSLFKSLPRLYSWSTCSSGIKSQKHLPQYLTAFPLMKHPPQPESSRWQTWTSLGSWRYFLTPRSWIYRANVLEGLLWPVQRKRESLWCPLQESSRGSQTRQINVYILMLDPPFPTRCRKSVSQCDSDITGRGRGKPKYSSNILHWGFSPSILMQHSIYHYNCNCLHPRSACDSEGAPHILSFTILLRTSQLQVHPNSNNVKTFKPIAPSPLTLSPSSSPSSSALLLLKFPSGETVKLSNLPIAPPLQQMQSPVHVGTKTRFVNLYIAYLHILQTTADDLKYS